MRAETHFGAFPDSLSLRAVFIGLCVAWATLGMPLRSATAKTLVVGPDQTLKVPSAAARVATNGDTIEIEPVKGGYYDCAVWRADDLTIEGEGAGVVLTDTTCEGKAIFVTVGRNTTIRNLTFQRARVPDRNGAGIRAEGANLTVVNSRFINNEGGILVADRPDSVINVVGSQFIDNGECLGWHCVGGIDVGLVRLLHVEHCTFAAERAGDDIMSVAAVTELTANVIEDGTAGAAAYLVNLPYGGSLIMKGNELEQGPRSTGTDIAVKIMAGVGAQAVQRLVFDGNRLQNHTGSPLIFVSNWSGARAEMRGNTYFGAVTDVSSAGYDWFFIKSFLRYSFNIAKHFARSIKSLS